MQKGFSRLINSNSLEITQIEDLLEEKKWKPTEEDFLLIDRFVAKSFDEDEENRIND
jgi:excinuclease ABC subunit A